MAMLPTRNDFTSNDELDTLVPGDPTIEITGYVDAIGRIRTVGKPKRSMYKFVINNDQGRRVRIILWEDKATLYEPVIIHREVSIRYYIQNCGRYKYRSTYFFADRLHQASKGGANIERDFKPGDNISPFEIAAQKTSSIELLGQYYLGGRQDLTIYKQIKLSESADSSGAICVEGYITLPFEFEMLGYSSCGTGAITDGTHKLRIQIVQLDVDTRMWKGAYICVQGTLKKDSLVGVYLMVRNMNNITIIDDN